MNRHDRRAKAAAERRAPPSREDAIAKALVALRLASADPTVTGGTLVMPDGEMLYLSADLVAPSGSAKH